VALFLDQLVPLHIYSRTFNTDVSGIVTIEPDVALAKAFHELSEKEQERRFRNDDATGLPPNSKDFALVRNKAARRKVPKDFQNLCLTEGYDQSI
jgi:hypothetical protein